MARAALRWGTEELAIKALVARATVIRIEADLPARPASVVAIQEVLERAGIVFSRNAQGDRVQLTYAAECMRDLVRFASSIDGVTKVHVAIQLRIDRFLAEARRYSGARGRTYVNDLKQRISDERHGAEPATREALQYAINYIRKAANHAD